MKAANSVPLDWYIPQDMLLEDLLYEVQISNNPVIKVKYSDDKIKLNKQSLKTLLLMLRRCILRYLKDCEIFDDGRIEIEVFPGLRLYAYDEPGRQIINKLTKKQMYQEPRRRYGAYFSRYFQREWNGFNNVRKRLRHSVDFIKNVEC